MKLVTAKIPESQFEQLDKIADEHDTSRSAVLRSVIDNGLRVEKYHPEEFPIDPERHEMKTAPELAKDGELPQ